MGRIDISYFDRLFIQLLPPDNNLQNLVNSFFKFILFTDYYLAHISVNPTVAALATKMDYYALNIPARWFDIIYPWAGVYYYQSYLRPV